MEQQTGRGSTADTNGVMSADEYEKRMTALDKEHDRRAALVNRSDPDADERLDRLDSWHAKMTDMIDAQYCSPQGAADDDVGGDRGGRVQRLEQRGRRGLDGPRHYPERVTRPEPRERVQQLPDAVQHPAT